MQSIQLRSHKGLQEYNPSNIIRIQGMSNYSIIYFVDNSRPLTVAKVLHWFEDNLPQEMFWRTHKTHLVNNNYILSMNTSIKPFLILNNGEHLCVSRRRVKQFKAIA